VAHQPLTIGDYSNALLYYANVEERGGMLYTLTSRTLAFVGVGETLEEAEAIAEKAASSVSDAYFTAGISAPGITSRNDVCTSTTPP